MGKLQFLSQPINLKRYRLIICCPILMIQRLHGATCNLQAAFYYDYAHFLQIVIIYEITSRCLTRLISETVIRIGSLSRWGGNDDGV